MDAAGDIVELTRSLVDIESVSHNETPIADAIAGVLAGVAHLEVIRDGNTLLARTGLGRDSRVVIAGHHDTVPVAGNLPSRLDGDQLYGLGSCDMKGGLAIALKLAVTQPAPRYDITYVFYEGEEVEARFNGLGRIARTRPDLLAADFAILMEPSDAGVEAGCQGTLRFEVSTTGRRAHSARSWMGENAIHAAGQIIDRLDGYQPRVVPIDGLEYREGLNAVGIRGGVAGNVIPDAATVTINYRFAPDRSEDEAVAHIRAVFAGFALEITDSAPGALPGLHRPAAAAFVEAVGATPRPKFGWTDVARFSAVGIPAVNYGPGDPSLAHTAGEFVPVRHLYDVEEKMGSWLTA
jgi:succinyl-diaminopimelate desuccinylase